MFNPVFTDTGRQATEAANGQGLSLQITHVALGDAKYDVRDGDGTARDVALSATDLQSQKLKVPIYSGGSPEPGSLLLSAEIPPADGQDDPTFYISEVGFLAEDGTLVAVWSSSQNNLGYRSDLGSWYLSLGMSWVDMPADAIDVSVQNAPLSEQTVKLERVSEQLKTLIEGAGYSYDPADADALAKAVDQRVESRVSDLDVAVRPPIPVSPDGADDVVLTPTLVAAPFSSPDRYTHVASRFRVARPDNTLVHDSGEIEATESYTVPAGVLATETDYKWDVWYKGRLGDRTTWARAQRNARFTTANIFVDPPQILTPSDGAGDVGPQPTLTTEAFSVKNGSDTHVQSRYQIATDSGFATIVWDSGDVGDALTEIQVPDGTLSEGTTYYVRARHTGDKLGTSGWSQAITVTTRDAFVYVRPPAVNAPGDGATDVALAPQIKLGPFEVRGGSDTHVATRIQIRLEAGSWDNPVYDTGELSATTSHTLTDANGLDPERDYRVRARYKGDALGWSEWSEPVAITTGIPAGEMIFTAAGSHDFTVPAGVDEISVVCIGAGGGWDPGTSSSFGQFLTADGGDGDARGGVSRASHFGGSGGGRGGLGGHARGGGGGGAAGYTGRGGDGGAGDTGEAGQGGGGAGGNEGTDDNAGGGGGGGVGPDGAGSNGQPGTGVGARGGGGSGGDPGGAGGNGDEGNGGKYGGGAGGGGGGTNGTGGGCGGGLGYGRYNVTPGEVIPVTVGTAGAKGGAGAVRVIWGAGRSYPDHAA